MGLLLTNKKHKAGPPIKGEPQFHDKTAVTITVTVTVSLPPCH